MSAARTSLFMLLSLVFFCASSLSAQTITVYPEEFTKGLNNPLKGFRDGIFHAESGDGKWGVPEYNTIWRHYIPWSLIENSETDGVQKILDFCNNSWKGCEAANVRIIPRIYIDWDSKAGNEYWPADILTLTGLSASDPALWAHPIVKDRIVKLIMKLGQVWDNDPRVAWIQTGIIGYWGEQENPVGVDEDGWALRLGQAYSTAFINKKLIVRNQHDWDAHGYKWGVYWDSYGHPGQRTGAWENIQNTNAVGRYKTEFIEGEVAYDWGTDVFDPMYGGEPELTLNKTQYANNMIDVIRELHCTGLGWISSYLSINDELKGVVNIDSIKANASRMQNEFGYRFALSEFTCAARAEPGNDLNLSFKVTNTASAPFYYNWPVALVLIDEATRQIKEKIIIPDIDITTWLPGDNYNYSSSTYQIPAITHQINASVTVPAGLTTGKYLVGISILEPFSQSPGIFFAVENFFKESQTQPLARIGIGVDAGAFALDGILFDDPQMDDARYYSTTPGKTFSLTTAVSNNGSISVSDGDYPEFSNIIVKATPDSGYYFSSWGGDLAGSSNPATLSMNKNKTIWANFKSIGTANNLFTNGDFSSGDLLGWGLNTVAPSTASASVDEGECSVNISNDDGMHWHVSLMQYNIALINGVQYTLKFKARSQENRSLATKVQLNADPWTSIHDGTVQITTSMDSYSVTWVQTQTGSNFKIGFFLGSQGANTVWFDDVELIADGSSTTFTITPSATNGAIILNPSGGTYDAGSSVSLTALPDAGYKFTGWSGNLSGNTNPLSVLLDKNINVTANFALITYTLSTTAINGTISMDPSGGGYIPGTVVTLTATPKAGYLFTGWSGDLTGTTNPATITIDKNQNITANFTAITFTLTTNATYGLVSLNPTGGSYNAGTQVTLTASPNAGYEFSNWSDDLSGSENPIKITMDANKSVTAIFKRITFTLTTNTTNGSVLMDPDGGIYTSGSYLTITALPDAGYEFYSWSGDLSGNQNPATIIMNKNKSISAIFNEILNSINTYGVNSENAFLGQNFPNPFTSETTIPYELKEASHIKISIFNLLGQEVCTIVDNQRSPGKYNIHWNGRDKYANPVTKGIYICQMKSDLQSIQIRKLIVE